MNILIFSQRFWPENFRINLITEKLNKNNKLYVLTEKPNYPNKNIPQKYKNFFFHSEKRKKINILRVPTIKRGKSSLGLFFLII